MRMKEQKPLLLEREQIYLKASRGGGILSYEVWGHQTHNKTVVTRYNLAYINPAIFTRDNGRVLGYDNAHDYHHRHWFGAVEAVSFTSYEEQLERFQQEWSALMQSIRRT
jgi:hypothetical protein